MLTYCFAEPKGLVDLNLKHFDMTGLEKSAIEPALDDTDLEKKLKENKISATALFKIVEKGKGSTFTLRGASTGNLALVRMPVATSSKPMIFHRHVFRDRSVRTELAVEVLKFLLMLQVYKQQNAWK